MNSIVLANLFENPLLLAAIILIGALYSWLTKRREAGALDQPGESESPPSPSEPENPTRLPDLQEILRQLLGGEPPVVAPSPPRIPRGSADDPTPPVGYDSEQTHPGRTGLDESSESYEALPQRLNRPAEHSRQHTVVASATAKHVESGDGDENTVRRGQAKHPVRAMHAAHRRHSSVGGPGVRLWRDPRIVRRAFVASLVFAPPKGLET